MIKFQIDVYSHSFMVKTFYGNERDIIANYCRRLAVYEKVWDPNRRRKVMKVKAIYATRSYDRKTYGFLIEELESLLNYLKQSNYTSREWQINKHTAVPGEPIDIALLPGVKPRDSEQEAALAFISESGKRNRVLPLRTGGGKTATSLMAIAQFKVRTALVMGATYIDTWIKSIDWVLGYGKDDILVIRGRKSLEDLITLRRQNELTQKLIFFSISTLRAFLEDHLDDNLAIEGVTPLTLMEFLGVGVRVVDEAHTMPHALVRDTIHTHVGRNIYLSATIESEDSFIQSMYDKMFPMKDRFGEGTNNKHAEAICVRYYLEDSTGLKVEGPRGYSHVMYETWIMKRAVHLSNYMDLVMSLIKDFYLVERKADMRCLVFCNTIEMCALMAAGIKARIEVDGLSISDYTGSHDESVLYETDIVVSTPKSAGTGKDIPNLRTCINTVAIGSVQLNRQCLGRLRPLEDYPDISPTYLWLECADIPKHTQYSWKIRTDHFPSHTKSITSITSNILV